MERPGQRRRYPAAAPGVSHSYHADDARPWSIYWVHFQGQYRRVQPVPGYREGRNPVTRVGVAPQLVAHFRGLLAVHRTGYNTRAFINAANQLRHLFTQVALEMRRARADSQQGFKLETVQSFMLEHLAQPWTWIRWRRPPTSPNTTSPPSTRP